MRKALGLSALIAAASLAGGVGAFAAEDAPIATAPPAATPAPLTSIPGVAVPDPTADQIDAWLKADGSSVRRVDPNQAEALTPGPRVIHGEVGATVSNRGYSAYAASAIPIGQASELDVAVAGGHVSYPHGGSANPKSLAVGLYLDGRDVDNWISHRNCGVPRWGVALKDDPQVQPDGSCQKKQAQSADNGNSAHHRHGGHSAPGASAPRDGLADPTPDQASAIGPVATQPGSAPTP